ncbi:MAG: sortase, partial [Evtepia sp.]
VLFTDADGNQFRYTVAQVETLAKTAVEEMAAGDWDLTLFTCTLGGQTRVTVRCVETKDFL